MKILNSKGRLIFNTALLLIIGITYVVLIRTKQVTFYHAINNFIIILFVFLADVLLNFARKKINNREEQIDALKGNILLEWSIVILSCMLLSLIEILMLNGKMIQSCVDILRIVFIMFAIYSICNLKKLYNMKKEM